MNEAKQAGSAHPWNWLLLPFSAVVAGQDAVYAASAGYGIYRLADGGGWEKLPAAGLDKAAVNRLAISGNTLAACTDRGLFYYRQNLWAASPLAIPCYRYRLFKSGAYAATEYGLWYSGDGNWHPIACQERKVYDFIHLPHYLVIAHDNGISVYDRFAGEWAEFPLPVAVTSLSVYRGHIVGSCETGELVVGNKRGGFELIRIPGRFVFSVTDKGGDVYACTDRGLYRLGWLQRQISLFSVRLGFPVTDIEKKDGELLMATLFQGVQSMPAP
ncbi:hypothetical protein ABEV74_01050 [Paenibacillus cisolokensis]|uniref:Uncharacterized protein n=1 Tax=Paenibacillus cisolokensis TaxID=1658519 RepID=A0ABQ4NDX9_9BACL|nr:MULTISPECIES: hypothetical protein [Paenibacillus]ALS30105.1 hypothetical protein IJ21_47430 [Paenibacillus sp. 32O-W]GIQ66410.1 hypothetical protein PACILC2_49780 [Paenibacillus cisolokensis]